MIHISSRSWSVRCVSFARPSHAAVVTLALTFALAAPVRAQLTPDWNAVRFGGIVGLNRATFGGDLALDNLGSLTGGLVRFVRDLVLWRLTWRGPGLVRPTSIRHPPGWRERIALG
ncbi:MAG: hypothetical protein HC794_04810 [Nitrospiraceae bacterium]|nr:hypothetical protein [Nitrospiraceae bacterium]